MLYKIVVYRATCEDCGLNIDVPLRSRAQSEEYLRKLGWTCSSKFLTTVCPKCRNQRIGIAPKEAEA